MEEGLKAKGQHEGVFQGMEPFRILICGDGYTSLHRF